MIIQSLCLIALSYKRKVLLRRHENYTIPNSPTIWSFIERRETPKASLENNIRDAVAKETNITLPSITLLASSSNELAKSNLYHAGLTDKNVNEMKRPEGDELQFFSLPEVEKLTLTQPTQMLFSQNKALLEAVVII